MRLTLTERVTRLEESLDGMGKHYDAMLERMGIFWPDLGSQRVESDSGTSSILPAPRLKSNRLAREAIERLVEQPK